MRQHGLLVQANPRLKATRMPSRSKPRPTAPQQWWGIDMIKVMVEPIGWVDVVIVRDWYTKKIVGHDAGLQAKSTHWRLALEQAVQRQFQAGGPRPGVVADERQWVSANVSRLHEDLCNAWNHAGAHELCQLERERRDRTAHADPTPLSGRAPWIGNAPGRRGSLVQHAIFAFGARVSDAVSGRIPT